MMSKINYLFILFPNSFPLICSITFLNSVLSLFFFFKISMIFFSFNIILSSLTGLIWWYSYSNEFFYLGTSSYNLTVGMKFSFLMFICSEIFFFFSFFWSYFHYFLSPMMVLNHVWPPYNVLMFNFIDVPMLNTFILLSSGLTVTVSHFMFFNNKYFLFSLYLFITVILGLLFSFFQYTEYMNSFFSYYDSCFGSIFFTLTGFHGIHVLIGSFFLFFCLIRTFFLILSSEFLSLELSIWYWHFVDVVWIFLYFFVYILSN